MAQKCSQNFSLLPLLFCTLQQLKIKQNQITIFCTLKILIVQFYIFTIIALYNWVHEQENIELTTKQISLKSLILKLQQCIVYLFMSIVNNSVIVQLPHLCNKVLLQSYEEFFITFSRNMKRSNKYIYRLILKNYKKYIRL